MSIQYERDDDRQIVVIALDGAMPSIEDIRKLFQRRRAESVWHYGALYDLRRMTGRPSFDYLRDLVANAASFVPHGQTRGPVVFLTADSVLYGIAASFVAFEGAKANIQVFREIGPAEVWLSDEIRRASIDGTKS
jgi:hypothetical protein